jgi:hypothetical protein
MHDDERFLFNRVQVSFLAQHRNLPPIRKKSLCLLKHREMVFQSVLDI